MVRAVINVTFATPLAVSSFASWWGAAAGPAWRGTSPPPVETACATQRVEKLLDALHSCRLVLSLAETLPFLSRTPLFGGLILVFLL